MTHPHKLPLDSLEHMAARFNALADFLTEYRRLWEPRPFAELTVGWEAEFPSVAAWLRHLPDAMVDQYWDSGFPETLTPPLLSALQRQADTLCAVPLAQGPPMPERRHPVAWHWRIKGRKLEQLQKFTSAALQTWPECATGIVDWCAGKGHLGRSLAWALDVPVTFVEIDPVLASMGQQLATRMGVTHEMVISDVLDPKVDQVLTPDRAVFALHACGILGDDLLLRGGGQHIAGLYWAPCCYHRTGPTGKHRYLSEVGQKQGPYLSKSALRLAIADEVVAPDRQRRARRREQQWRLGWDLLRREVLEVLTYQSPGMLPAQVVQLPLSEFCEHLAHREGWQIPTGYGFGELERRAAERLREAGALSLVRGLFRRPLELLHVLDRALKLEELGYNVDVVRFCDRTLTPRDLLIRGVRRGQPQPGPVLFKGKSGS